MLSVMRWIPPFLCLLFAVTPLPGEEQKVQTPAAERSVESLRSIAEPLAAALTELQKLQDEQKGAVSEDAKAEIQGRIDAERERVRNLRENFRDIVGGSEAAEYDGGPTEGAGIQEQISELVQPVLSEIREATYEPRELDKLSKSLVSWEERKRKTDTVLGRIDDLIALGVTERWSRN
jgi:hypothetical protein